MDQILHPRPGRSQARPRPCSRPSSSSLPVRRRRFRRRAPSRHLHPSAPAPSSSPAAPSAAPAAFHWAAPADGATQKKRRLTLSVTADSDASGDNATVVFTVDWPGSAPKQACETEAKAGGALWECEVDLAALKAPSGPLHLDFDVTSGGATDKSPDGRRTLDYQPPAPTWRTARTILPKSCDLPALAVDAGRYHVASTCGNAIRYAEGAATGAWTEKTFRAPADHVEAGPQLAVDGNTLYLAYTRYGPVTDAETCGDGVGVQGSGRLLPHPDPSRRQVVGPEAHRQERRHPRLDASRRRHDSRGGRAKSRLAGRVRADRRRLGRARARSQARPAGPPCASGAMASLASPTSTRATAASVSRRWTGRTFRRRRWQARATS